MAKLLVVVDYQNDFVNGALGFVKAETLEKGICNKIEEYLNRGYKVIFTYDTHFENYLNTREGKKLPVKHCIIDTEGHDLYGELNKFKDVENTLHYNKKSFGLSPEDMLDIAEKVYEDIEEIELVGVVTNICVISNAVTFQSQFVDAEIIVDASLTAGFDEEMHKKSLEVMESFQVKVINR